MASITNELSITKPSSILPAEQNNKKIEVLPTLGKERAFSAKKYFAIALVVALVAGAVFSACMPASIVLFAIAGWYLWSATIVVANRVAEGTKLATPIHRLHSIAMEVNAGVASAFLFPITLLPWYHGPQGKLTGRPILLVNGYLSFGATWHYQRERLVEAGFGPIYTMNVGSGKSIKTYAKYVQAQVEKIQKDTDRNDLILIGHSKGGLVTSYYATHLADPSKTKISDVITIGSPLSGTPLAYLGLGYDASEMRSRAPLHKTLREEIKKHPEIRFSHIASESDEVVPLSSALLGEDKSRQLILKDMGHLGLVFSSRVADQVCTWLK
jgi:predicted alpha/beta hydrolase family esterase